MCTYEAEQVICCADL